MKPAVTAIFAAVALGGTPAVAGTLLLVCGAIGAAILVWHVGPVLLLRLACAYLAAAADTIQAAREEWRRALARYREEAMPDQKTGLTWDGVGGGPDAKVRRAQYPPAPAPPQRGEK